MVMGDTHASSHSKVGQSSGDCDQGGDEVVETFGLVKQSVREIHARTNSQSRQKPLLWMMQTYNRHVP